MQSVEKHDQELIKYLLKKYIGEGKIDKNYTHDVLVTFSNVSIPVISRIANRNSLVNLLSFAYLIQSLVIDANEFFYKFVQHSNFIFQSYFFLFHYLFCFS